MGVGTIGGQTYGFLRTPIITLSALDPNPDRIAGKDVTDDTEALGTQVLFDDRRGGRRRDTHS